MVCTPAIAWMRARRRTSLTLLQRTTSEHADRGSAHARSRGVKRNGSPRSTSNLVLVQGRRSAGYVGGVCFPRKVGNVRASWKLLVVR